MARANTTTREQQSVIARWTGENICRDVALNVLFIAGGGRPQDV